MIHPISTITHLRNFHHYKTVPRTTLKSQIHRRQDNGRRHRFKDAPTSRRGKTEEAYIYRQSAKCTQRNSTRIIGYYMPHQTVIEHHFSSAPRFLLTIYEKTRIGVFCYNSPDHALSRTSRLFNKLYKVEPWKFMTLGRFIPPLLSRLADPLSYTSH